MVRRGEPVAAGGRAVAVTRHRADAALLAASLPALAVPNRLRLAEKGKGASCLALSVESLDAEELPILGRALMRRVEGAVLRLISMGRRNFKMPHRAKLFATPEGQAVRLPEEYRFDQQEEVLVYKEGRRVILEPERRRWSRRFLKLAGSARDFPYPDEPPPAEPAPHLD